MVSLYAPIIFVGIQKASNLSRFFSSICQSEIYCICRSKFASGKKIEPDRFIRAHINDSLFRFNVLFIPRSMDFFAPIQISRRKLSDRESVP